ncbi:MAG TPA: hypothetical protein VGK18_06170 [Propionicimonas sp.]|uniref:hypothetical protein n=1 Tax=Propionicimonas sp. TaxID=1955623 RepID=UPI002F423905
MTLPRRLAALLMVLALAVTGAIAPQTATAATATLTNLRHLDFLLDEVRPVAVAGHDTYLLGSQPALLMPWTYADARDNGQFARVGGGSLDPATGHYGQGAFNADDVARAAVVYLRHWRLTGSSDSRAKAYELLRSVAYLQTDTGANRGRTVLWIQSDGTLNPSAEPVELPDPSDSGPSYWQARSLWAFGEGYAAFRRSDPAFAAFLQQRIQLSVRALERDVLSRYRHFDVADGRRVPAWLIVDGADATSEAVLGLAAYVRVAPRDAHARRALGRFAEGIADLSAGSRETWPYDAILPWTQSRSLWHAWASQTGAALARAAATLDRRALARPAVAEALSFDPTLLTGDGADNGWLPTPVETVQIAYGVDSRVQSLLAVADTTGTDVAGPLAALHASWFFGANRSGEAMYSPATGVTFDGLEADGRINRNSGAESTIHGLLTMLALDAHPRVRALATSLHGAPVRNGLRTVEAESASPTTGSVSTPASAWTGESSWSGGAYLHLATGQQATIALGGSRRQTLVEPVSWQPENGRARTRWTGGTATLGTLSHRVGEQGITAAPGALLPQLLRRSVAGDSSLTVTATRGAVDVDALLLRPALSTATFVGDRAVTLLFSVSGRQLYRAEQAGSVRTYDARGGLVAVGAVAAGASVTVPARGVVVLVTR